MESKDAAQGRGWQGQKAQRSSGSQFVAPGLHINTGLLKNLEPAEQQKAGVHMRRHLKRLADEENLLR